MFLLPILSSWANSFLNPLPNLLLCDLTSGEHIFGFLAFWFPVESMDRMFKRWERGKEQERPRSIPASSQFWWRLWLQLPWDVPLPSSCQAWWHQSSICPNSSRGRSGFWLELASSLVVLTIPSLQIVQSLYSPPPEFSELHLFALEADTPPTQLRFHLLPASLPHLLIAWPITNSGDAQPLAHPRPTLNSWNVLLGWDPPLKSALPDDPSKLPGHFTFPHLQNNHLMLLFLFSTPSVHFPVHYVSSSLSIICYPPHLWPLLLILSHLLTIFWLYWFFFFSLNALNA